MHKFINYTLIATKGRDLLVITVCLTQMLEISEQSQYVIPSLETIFDTCLI